MALPLIDFGSLLAADLSTARPELQVEIAPADQPVALLPVRLETRFFDRADGTVELRVRIYPDKIHLDSHDPALSAEEVAAGQTYWQAQWQAGDDTAALKLAWRELTDRFDPGRAAWIVRATTPTNAAARSTTASPTFPDLGPPSTRQQIPVARLLPDRWTATAYRDGQVLAVARGADVRADLPVAPDVDGAVSISDDTPAIDDGMRWMVDFEAAETAGMALRLPLDASAVVDVLIVSGVRTGTDGPTDFTRLLDAHHFADGLGFLAAGTPSNNSDAGRAGYSSRDLRGERSFGYEIAGRTATPGSNADRIARAFGIDAATFAVEGGPDTDELPAAMATALWPATWGYYLTQMMGVALADADWARDHVRAFVRPGGDLPVLRVGRQPYGVLPVTSLRRLADPDPRRSRVAALLAGLRDHVWRPAVPRLPRVGRSDDPNGDLIDVLRTDAVSSSVLVRRLMGPHYLRHLRLFLGEDLDALNFWSRLQSITAPVADQVGLGIATPAAQIIFENGTRPVTTDLVGDPSYLGGLSATTDPETLARPVPDQPVPLLQALVRHALLRTNAEAGARLLSRPDLVRDAELVDLVSGQSTVTPTWSWQRSQLVPGSTQTVAQALASTADGPLIEFRTALQILAGSPPDVLERQLLLTLDATSHRLDAWITSLVGARLSELRAAQPSGLTVGGYGWVEGLRREPATPSTDQPADEPGPLLKPDSDPGFVHAPSLNQATAAAILRNAHLAHGGAADSPYAMQLTSEHVRTAERLFDGVRQGQPLGALLGYDVERRLHAAQLDDLIDDFRAIAPRPDVEGADAKQRRLILDGMVLHRLWTTDPDSVLAQLPNAAPRRTKIVNVMTALATAIDSAADAVTAEGVYQFARGNLARSAVTLDAIAGADAAPPALTFHRTPRTGIALTHRVAVLLDAEQTLPAGWSADTPRARAEPALNAWVGQLLGPAPTELAGGAPLDFLAADSPPADLRTVASAISDLISGSRGLDGADLQPPHADPDRGLDLNEFEARAVAAHTALAAATAAEAAGFGIAVGPLDGPAAGLIEGAVLAEVKRRVADADTYARAPADEGPSARRDRIERRFKAVFGPGFVAVPRFRSSTAADVSASLSDPSLTDDPLASETWLLRMERVRPGLARFGLALRHSQLLAGTISPLLRLAQVPHVAGQRWVGLPPTDQPLRQGVISLGLHGAPADLSRPLVGLLVDEWTEVIPSTTETTAIAFRYDPPDAMAPQAILLAVPPVSGVAWTLGTLNEVLLETLDLAHLRVVGPDALGDAQQYLPAAVLAFNVDGDAVSTDLNPLTR